MNSKITVPMFLFALFACGETQQETTAEGNGAANSTSQNTAENSGSDSTPSNSNQNQNTEEKKADFQGLEDTAKLFKSYVKAARPARPKLRSVDYSNLGECYTKAQKKANRGTNDLCSKLRSEKKNSESENRSSEKSYDSFAKKHLIIDYDWKDKKGYLRKDKFGCWNESLRVWNPAKKEKDCSDGKWTLRSYKFSASSKGYKYSATTTAKKPALMVQIDKKKVDFPDEIFCEVTQLAKSGKGSKVSCKSYGTDYYIKAHNGVRLDINIGDIISIPFGKAPKEDTLLKKSGSTMIVRADSNALKVVKANDSCPSQEALNPHICRFATSSYDPKETYTACAAVGNFTKVATLAKKWDRNKKIADKSNFMIDVLKNVVSKDGENLWAQLALVQNQIDADKKSDAAATIKTFVSKVDDKKELGKAVKLAAKLEDEALTMSIYQKLCDAGDKRSCKKLPQPDTE